jgi:hypothetical protein
MLKGTTSKGMKANKNFGKWLGCGIQISGTFGLHLKPEDLEKVRVSSLLSLVATTELGLVT